MAESKMTPKERAAMQQALEALESYSKSDYIKKQHPKRRANGEKAITALREALAEQAEQEPVCIDWDTKTDEPIMGYAAPQPVKQEPVATVVDESEEQTNTMSWILSLPLPVGTKLYAAPVRTKDLTDDEILEITKRFALGIAFPVGGATTPEMFARAVIAADREKNK